MNIGADSTKKITYPLVCQKVLHISTTSSNLQEDPGVGIKIAPSAIKSYNNSSCQVVNDLFDCDHLVMILGQV